MEYLSREQIMNELQQSFAKRGETWGRFSRFVFRNVPKWKNEIAKMMV